MSRRAARVDGNQQAVVDALRAAGCFVQSLAEVGKGCPDLLVGVDKINVLLEVKDPSQSASDTRLTPAQKKWHTEYTGTAHVVYTVAQALEVIAFYRNGRKSA